MRGRNGLILTMLLAMAAALGVPYASAATQTDCTNDTVGASANVRYLASDRQISYQLNLPKPACKELTVNGDTFVLPDSYDGSGRFNDSALPQRYLPEARVSLTVAKDSKTGRATSEKLSVTCGWVQADVYIGQRRDVIDKDNQLGADRITADILQLGNKCEQPEPPQSAKPTVEAKAAACVNNAKPTTTASVTVANTDDDTDATVSYTVEAIDPDGVVAAKADIKDVADGKSGTNSFDEELYAGEYSVTVTGSDGTSATTTLTVKDCPPGPPVLRPDNFDWAMLPPDCFDAKVFAIANYSGDGVPVVALQWRKNGQWLNDGQTKPMTSKEDFEFAGSDFKLGESRTYRLVAFFADQPGDLVVLSDTVEAVRPSEQDCTVPPLVKTCPKERPIWKDHNGNGKVELSECRTKPTQHNSGPNEPVPPATPGRPDYDKPHAGLVEQATGPDQGLVVLGFSAGFVLLMLGAVPLWRRRCNGAGS